MGTDSNSGFDHVSDAELIRGIHGKKPEALAAAYERYGSHVFGLARHLSGQREAERTTRETFLVLWQSPGIFAHDSVGLGDVLLAQAHARTVVLQRTDVDRRAREATMTGDELESQLLIAWPNEGVRQRMLLLPKHERQAIVLAYFGGYSHKEVAVFLEHSDKEIRIDIASGLRHLRDIAEERPRDMAT